MRDLEIVAESSVHHGRRLLIGAEGAGYIQLAGGCEPIPVPAAEFARLRAMRHYRKPVEPRPAERDADRMLTAV